MKKLFKGLLATFLIFNLLISTVGAYTMWVNKPPQGSVIDWGHPLANGLVGCWLLNENGTNSIADLTSSLKIPLVNSAYWNISSFGVGVVSNAYNMGGRLVGLPEKLKPTTSLTLIWRGKILGDHLDAAFQPDLVGVAPDNLDSNPYACYRIFRVGNDQDALACGWNNGATSYRSLTTQDMVATGGSYFFAMTHGGGAVKFYKNGLLVNSTTTNVGTITYTANATLSFGRGGKDYNQYSNTITNQIIIYNKVLSPSEIKQLYDDPYCFIKQPNLGLWAMVSNAVQGAFNVVYSSSNRKAFNGGMN
jgi:hypothetical protein